MSDEEKKAVIYLKSYCINDVLYDNKHYEQIKTVLNLIEKQSKEIEELKRYKEGYKLLSYSLDNYIAKDKIKAKIEELDNNISHIWVSTNYDENLVTEKQKQIEILQSLLEKE